MSIALFLTLSLIALAGMGLGLAILGAMLAFIRAAAEGLADILSPDGGER
jgi:hypothetical protein